MHSNIVQNTSWKVTKYWISFGPNFPIFGPEKTPYLDTFLIVKITVKSKFSARKGEVKVFEIGLIKSSWNKFLNSHFYGNEMSDMCGIVLSTLCENTSTNTQIRYVKI